MALLLASIASANSFVLGSEITGWRAASGRGADDPTPPRDVAEDCRAAVATATEGWWHSPLIEAVRPGAVAVAAAIASTLPTAAPAVLREWSCAPDRRVAIAVAITDDLARGADPAQRLREAGPLEAEIADMVASLADFPPDVLAVQVVLELCSRVAADGRCRAARIT